MKRSSSSWKYRLKRIAVILFIISAILSCAILFVLAVQGGWNWLVSTISALIAQGPAAIVSAILAVLFSYYCLIPLLIIVVFIAFVVFIYRI